MDRDDIIRMARSAIRLAAKDTDLTNFDQEATILDRYEFLYWFAKEAAAAEREACAQILDRNVAVCGNNTPMRDVLAGNAMAIRARSAL